MKNAIIIILSVLLFFAIALNFYFIFSETNNYITVDLSKPLEKDDAIYKKDYLEDGKVVIDDIVIEGFDSEVIDVHLASLGQGVEGQIFLFVTEKNSIYFMQMYNEDMSYNYDIAGKLDVENVVKIENGTSGSYASGQFYGQGETFLIKSDGSFYTLSSLITS